jgi:O-antigen/teichoic acid export membrane protein
LINIAALRRNTMFLNLSSLYLSLGVNAVLTLILMGYLARVLQPEVWGYVLLAQAFGFWVATIPEFGFTLSAGRAVAQCQDPEEVSAVARSVNLSRILLSVLVIPVALIAAFAVPSFRAEPLYLVGGAAFAVAQGFDPIWLFMGIERQYVYAALSSLSRLLILGAAVSLIQSPADGWKVMFLHSAGAAGIFLAALIYARFKYPRAKRTPGSITRMLRTGWGVFQFRLVQSIGGSTLLVLGAVSPRSVEAFGSADRIARLSLGLIGPISGAGMPRIAKLVGSDRSAARDMARLNFAIMAGFGLLVSVLMIAGAPWIVRLILGPGYEFVVPVLRVIAIVLPFSAASNMIAVQWMLPLGLDRAMVKVTFVAGVLGVAGTGLFGWLYGAMGAAIYAVVVEVSLFMGTIATVRSLGVPRFWGKQEASSNSATDRQDTSGAA